MIVPTDVSLTHEQRLRAQLTALAYRVALEYGADAARRDLADGLTAAESSTRRASTPRPTTPRPVRQLHPEGPRHDLRPSP